MITITVILCDKLLLFFLGILLHLIVSFYCYHGTYMHIYSQVVQPCVFCQQ